MNQDKLSKLQAQVRIGGKVRLMSNGIQLKLFIIFSEYYSFHLSIFLYLNANISRQSTELRQLDYEHIYIVIWKLF